MPWWNFGSNQRDTSGGQMSDEMQAATLLDEADMAQDRADHDIDLVEPLHFDAYPEAGVVDVYPSEGEGVMITERFASRDAANASLLSALHSRWGQ